MPRFSRSAQTLPAGQDRRVVAGRFQTPDLRSSVGPVLDLSITGVAVLASSPYDRVIGQRSTIWMSMHKSERFNFQVEVRSSRKLGFRKHRVGLAFIDLTPEQRMMLTEFGSRAGGHEFGWGKVG
jgi:hypothetical protein